MSDLAEKIDKPSTPLRPVGPDGTPPAIVDVEEKYTADLGETFYSKISHDGTTKNGVVYLR